MAKILLVEDDTNLSEIYQARMEAEGYQVVAASDGESALALAAKEKPDLVISDVMMPKISGFEMLDILRNTDGLKNTPVIMLTALGQSDDKDRAESLGADRYLVKSQVTLEDIVNAAHSLLEGGAGSQSPQTQTAAMAAVAPATDPFSNTDTTSSPVVGDTADAGQQAGAASAPVDPAPTGPLSPTEPAVVSADPPPVTMPVIPLAVAPGVPSDTAPASPAQEVQSPPVPVVNDTPVADATPPGNNAQPAAEDAPAPVNFTQAGNIPAPNPPTATPSIPDANPAIPPSDEPLISAQTTAQESASVNDKIAGFAHRPIAPVQVPRPTGPMTRDPSLPKTLQTEPLPTMAPQATVPTAVETAVTPTEQIAPTAAAIDEKVVANAIDQLLTIQTAPPQAAPPSEHGRVLSSTPSDTPTPKNSSVQDDRPLKKVISPIERPAEATLEELLAKEEALEVAGDAANRQLFDPDAQPFDTSAATERVPEAAIPTQESEETKKQPFDPNSISL